MDATSSRKVTERHFSRYIEAAYREPNTGCWIWPGSMNVHGYGVAWFEGQQWRAHRASYVFHKGEIPEGMVVRHTCDMPMCVNPDHLLIGTQQDNVADMVTRGRAQGSHVGQQGIRGEANTSAKLTEADVRAIRADKRVHQVIADSYGVSRPAVSLIKSRKNWAHVA